MLVDSVDSDHFYLVDLTELSYAAFCLPLRLSHALGVVVTGGDCPRGGEQLRGTRIDR